MKNFGEDVQLSGTFSFHGRGGLGTVSELPRVITVRHGIRISGPATIREGSGAFYVDAGAGAIEFSALRFEDTTLAGIIVWSAAGVLVEDCEFDGVIPFQVIGRPFLMAHGVVVNPPMPAPTGGPPVLRHANVTGNVSVEDSMFDLRGSTPTSRTAAIAVACGGTVAKPMNVHIARNTIRNTTGQGIFVENITGETLIERNDLESGPFRAQAAFSNASGIALVPGTSGNTQNDGGLGEVTHTVLKNHIRYQGWQGSAIFVGAVANAVVKGNTIDVTEEPPPSLTVPSVVAGIRLNGARGSSILQNQISGHGDYAFLITLADNGAVPNNNTFVGNNHSGLSASNVDVFIHGSARGTVVVGGGGTVQDASPDALIKGDYTTVAGEPAGDTGGVGEDVSEAEPW